MPLTRRKYRSAILLPGLLLLYSCSMAEIKNQKNDNGCLSLISDTMPFARYGYINSKGDTVIPLGKYVMCFKDTFCNFAIVLKDSIGFIGINRDEKVLFKVFSYDNGPDDLSEGYFRIITKNKIGFADSTGKIIITPRFSAAYPFREGLAAFCNDCKLESNGEHSLWVDGKWGFVNKLGLVVIKPQFEKVFVGFANNIALVVLNGKKVKINKMGNVIEEVKE